MTDQDRPANAIELRRMLLKHHRNPRGLRDWLEKRDLEQLRLLQAFSLITTNTRCHSIEE